MQTHYETLKVSRDAPPEIIRMAYKMLCQKYHPDKYPENKYAAERITKQLTAAYAVLSNPDKRKAYDQLLEQQEAGNRQEKPNEPGFQDHKRKDEPKPGAQARDESEAKTQNKPNDAGREPPQGEAKPRQQPENHHPWRRMAARYIDMNIFALFGGLAFAYLIPFSKIQNPFIENLIYAAEGLAGCILLEPIVLMLFGGTLGKAILNIHLEKEYQSNEPLPFSVLLNRTFKLYYHGLWLGFRCFLIVAFFGFEDYKLMKRTGVTRWDKDCGTCVSFGPIGFFRFLGGTTLVLSFLIVTAVSNSLDRLERKKWLDATYTSSVPRQESASIQWEDLDPVIPGQAVMKPFDPPQPQDAAPAVPPRDLFDADTQFHLGDAYFYGKGVPQNYIEAAKWYRMAAEQGNVDAQYNLGFLYNYGKGVPQNYEEAAKWVRMAAEQGDAQAQYGLGLFYTNGQGVPQNHAEAAKWWRMAAKQGNTMAQAALTNEPTTAKPNYFDKYDEPPNATPVLPPKGLFDDVLGKPQDTASEKSAQAQFNRGLAYENGDGVPQSYLEAEKWYRMAAEQGLASAQNNLGELYYHGQGIKQDYVEALKWFRMAADQGLSNAQVTLGWAYMNGLGGLPVDYHRAVYWNQLGAQQGHQEGYNNLGWLYENGLGVPKNYQIAANLYRQAANLGNAEALQRLNNLNTQVTANSLPTVDAVNSKSSPSSSNPENAVAQFELGWKYQQADGLARDYAAAVYWYHKAAAQGHVNAQYNLGFMYQSGLGVTRDDKEAAKWYRKAAAKGDVQAKIALEHLLDPQQ